MSIRYVAAVLDNLPELSATDTLVLIALADYASDDTRQCWPSVPAIARRARITERAVQKRLRALEARGLIEVALGGHQYGRNTANQYRLKFDHHGQLILDVEPSLERHRPHAPKLSTRANEVHHGVNHVHPKGERGDRQGRTTFTPSVIEPSLNQETLQKRPRTKKIPPAEPARDLSAERERQLEELRKRGAAA